MQAVLRWFSQGKLFRVVFPWVLRLVALYLLVYGGYLWVLGWIEIGGPAGFIIATILYQLFFVGLLYALIHTLLIRASNIARLPEADYPAASAASLIARLVGELAAIIVTFVGVVGCLAIWSAGPIGGLLFVGIPLIPEVPVETESSFLFGLLLLFYAVVWAALYLLVTYLVAEGITVLVAIFRNTRTIRERLDQSGGTPGAP